MTGCFENTTSNVHSSVSAESSEPKLHRDGTENPTGSIVSGGSESFAQSVVPIETEPLTEADLARSSWENPFYHRLWSCEGWRLDKESMTCDSGDLPPATFLRPYRNVVVEFRLSRSDQPGDGLLTESSPALFELRLFDRATRNWAGLVMDLGSVSLKEFRENRTTELQMLREASQDFTNTHHGVLVRFTLTPNRVLVAINGRLKINAARPTAIMNTDCLLQFVSLEPGATLSELRIEGEQGVRY